jgi:FtsP/CotA-like multicopper oxidase with cupredoxin domain
MIDLLVADSSCATGLASGGVALQAMPLPWAQRDDHLSESLPTVSGTEISSPSATHPSSTETGHAITINGTVPALLRLQQGQNVRIAVTERLDEDTDSLARRHLALPDGWRRG